MNTIDLVKWANAVCDHTNTITQRGNWGPHKAKISCIDCGKHIKWLATQPSQFARIKGITFKEYKMLQKG